MLFDVAKLYERAQKMNFESEPRLTAQAILAAFWVQYNWNDDGPQEEAIRQKSDVLAAAVADLIACFEARKPLRSKHFSIEAEPYFALLALTRFCNDRLVDDINFSGVFGQSRQGTFEEAVLLDHDVKGCGKKFSIIERGLHWRKVRDKLHSTPIIDLAMPQHVVFSNEIYGYRIELNRYANEKEADALFRGDENFCAKAYAGYYSDHCDWPIENGKPIAFAPNPGFDLNARRDAFFNHLNEATEQGAAILLLPELTMTQDLVSAIIADLVRRSTDDKQCPLIMPGTFHAQVGAKRRNRAVVLSGTGEILISQFKLKPFVEESFNEGIDPGEHISILLTPIGPLAVFICRDFCDDEHPEKDVLRKLRLKNILVPSMGAKNTEDRHLTRLDGAASLNEWRVLIAQQSSDAKAKHFLYGRCPGCHGRGPESPETHFFIKKWL